MASAAFRRQSFRRLLSSSPTSRCSNHISRTADATSFPEFQQLRDGNAQFRQDIGQNFFNEMAQRGASPQFMFIGCSDSRVSEGTIFRAKPGTFFTHRNIANQFSKDDSNAHSGLSCGVRIFGVKHVVVMGHYGCAGIAAAITGSPSNPEDPALASFQSWLSPIRKLYQTSTRPEIVAMREQKHTSMPDDHPGFRALIEENVKRTVQAIHSDPVVQDAYRRMRSKAALQPGEKAQGPVYVHGMIYDVANGSIEDLGVTIGPPLD